MIKFGLLLVITIAVIKTRGISNGIFNKVVPQQPIFVKRDNGTNDTVVEVFPEFHLLNPDGINNGSGMLLAAVGDDIGHICANSGINYTEICRDLGHEDYLYTDSAEYYFNTSYIDEFPITVTDVLMAGITRYYYNASHASYCRPANTYLACEPKEEPTEPPIPVKDVYFEMISVDRWGDVTADQPEGMVIAIIVTDDDWDNLEYGSVCDDTVNQYAADIVCESKGYDGATLFGNIRRYNYSFPENVTRNVTTIMDQFNCPEGAESVQDCSYDLYQHDCSFSENLVVFCDNGTEPEQEYEIVYGALYQWDADEESPVQSNEGLAVLEVVNTRTGEQYSGTVCDDGFNNKSADIGCQAMGFDYAISWGNHRNYQYVPEAIVEEYLSIVVDEFNCPAAAQDISDCSYNLMTHDCSHSEDIVLVCSGGSVTSTPLPPITITTATPPQTTPPTWGPTSYPLDDEVAVKFGGLEVKMKVNPKKGRAKVVDILEEIGYIIG